jgi:hypothetical protein
LSEKRLYVRFEQMLEGKSARLPKQGAQIVETRGSGYSNGRLSKYLGLLMVVQLFARTGFGHDASLHDILARHGVRSVVVWRTKNEDLLCAITEGTEKGSADGATLACYSNAANDPLATFRVDPGNLQLEVLGLIGGPLIATWGTGSGYLYRAYAMRNGHIVKVWESGSFMPAESFTVDLRGTSFVIALAEPKWEATSSGAKEKVPGMARLFQWRDGEFVNLGQAPWSERVNFATAHAQQLALH